MRADARRNYDRMVAVAAEVVAEQGAGASLEEIARRAEVGSATLHRHFGGRVALLEAVFESSIEAVCARADELQDYPKPLQALTIWLHDMVGHITTVHGLGPALMMSAERGSQCHQRIRAAGQSLLDRAQKDGSVPADVAISDVLQLLNGITLASDSDTAQADRLVDLVIRGVAPGAS
ncbi:TetR/AcrR family transcriptional regulator [Kribbella kalugense]|uniref:TetR family transcriptional regulator n=1 Tax=Kribbella kalugense TaxID=2512221 RepID=A0A4R7ZFR0_9ACTN|nr:TetR/AcrR family transcriptional regulator [Kribbella kalugense]TDW15836.1 TetR family transcriptional regulator [Kribbella kalugense]